MASQVGRKYFSWFSRIATLLLPSHESRLTKLRRGKFLPVTQPVLFSSHDFHWLRQFRPLGDYKESNQVCLFVRLTEAKVAKHLSCLAIDHGKISWTYRRDRDIPLTTLVTFIINSLWGSLLLGFTCGHHFLTLFKFMAHQENFLLTRWRSFVDIVPHNNYL